MVGQGEPTPGPPVVPEGYGDFGAGGAEKLPWSQVGNRLVDARNYWLATTRPDGRPHAAPVWGVWFDRALYFGTDRHSQKGRNLAANPYLVAHLESGDDVVILEGVAEAVTDSSLLAQVSEAYAAKYQIEPTGGEGSEAVIYALRPRLAHSWLENDFLETATRWRFD